MTTEQKDQPPARAAPSAASPQPSQASYAAPSAPGLADLREILVGQEQRRLVELEAQVADLQRQVEDKDGLLALLTPVMTDAIRTTIRDHRSAMVEALYPIIGQLVVRAVGEAIRDLARSIDYRMRVSLSPQAIWQRIRARVRGVSVAELELRASLPFSIADLFLIHRQSGLLLLYLSRAAEPMPDFDVVGGMLTAIRDFTQEAFGQGREGQLDEIQYGARRILIETAQDVYLAIVVDGVEPPGFRGQMREEIVAVQGRHVEALRNYDGDAARFRLEAPRLRQLMADVTAVGS
ncbi:MAG: hypothetical protein QG637_1695 [Chloroflexota bacterium]|nr:hypothetical protein [Chloroflexota bacterium]